MLQGIFSKCIAVFILGLVIKLLDDEIDDDIILKKPQSKFYKNIAEFKFSYCLLFLAFSMLIETELTFSLFASAYMIGMFQIPRQELPFKLKGYQEIIILFFINIILIPIDIFSISFLCILLIQFIDDIEDYEYDFKYGYKNYAIRYGKGEIMIISSILIILCIMLSWLNTIIILSSNFLIKFLYAKI